MRKALPGRSSYMGGTERRSKLIVKCGGGSFWICAMRIHFVGRGPFALVVGLGEILDAVLTRAVPDHWCLCLGRPPSLRGTVENLPEPSSQACKTSGPANRLLSSSNPPPKKMGDWAPEVPSVCSRDARLPEH